jgi:hypothetical protein
MAYHPFIWSYIVWVTEKASLNELQMKKKSSSRVIQYFVLVSVQDSNVFSPFISVVLSHETETLIYF